MSVKTRNIRAIIKQDVWPVCAAYALVGVSFGAIAGTGAMPWWVPSVMAATIFAGSAQFAAIGIVLAGGGVVAAVLAGLVINTRLLAYSFAVRDALGDRPRCWLARAHLVTDVNTALVLHETGTVRRRQLFCRAGAWIFGVWNIAVALGLWLGNYVGDTSRLGLDAVLPAILFALVREQLDDPATRACAVLGCGLALASQAVVPPGLPELIALGGCLALWAYRPLSAQAEP